MMVDVTEKDGGSLEQRLYDAVARWNADTGYGFADMIHAACEALIHVRPASDRSAAPAW
jgi:hypothetical protein